VCVCVCVCVRACVCRTHSLTPHSLMQRRGSWRDTRELGETQRGDNDDTIDMDLRRLLLQLPCTSTSLLHGGDVHVAEQRLTICPALSAMHMPVFLSSINGKQHGGFPVTVVTKSLVLAYLMPQLSVIFHWNPHAHVFAGCVNLIVVLID